MSAAHLPEYKSVDRLAFEHYLRTGERLTRRQWRARYEQKFNPYHDQRGRFTTASGTSSPAWDPGARAQAARPMAAADPQVGPKVDAYDKQNARPGGLRPSQAAGTSTGPSANGFRSTFILDRVESGTSNADSYFELNKRQAQLDSLREEAGPNPAAAVRADLDEFQRRLDGNRIVLDARSEIADREVAEILRAGLSPYDIGVGVGNVASGKGEIRDYLAVAQIVPLGAGAGRLGRFAGRTYAIGETSVVTLRPSTQLGGPYSKVRRLRAHDAHHLVADRVSGIAKGDGPSIAMVPAHHRRTASYGAHRGAAPFRKQQAELVEKGDFYGAMQLGIDDVRSKFGDLYDEAIDQAVNAYRKKGGK